MDAYRKWDAAFLKSFAEKMQYMHLETLSAILTAASKPQEIANNLTMQQFNEIFKPCIAMLKEINGTDVVSFEKLVIEALPSPLSEFADHPIYPRARAWTLAKFAEIKANGPSRNFQSLFGEIVRNPRSYSVAALASKENLLAFLLASDPSMVSPEQSYFDTSFKYPYNTSQDVATNVPERLARYIRYIQVEFTKPKTPYYSPYFAIIQSSRYGKSRSIQELSKHGFIIVPICLRPEIVIHTQPPRTTHIADYLSPPNKIFDTGRGKVEWWSALLCQIVAAVKERYVSGNYDPVTWFQTINDNNEVSAQFWLDVVRGDMRLSRKEMQHSVNPILVIDEASALLTGPPDYFTNLVRALGQRVDIIVGVFLDTNSAFDKFRFSDERASSFQTRSRIRRQIITTLLLISG